MPAPSAPTPAQLRALRRLTLSRDMTSSWPETKAQASRQIALLVGYERTSALERRADRDATVMHGSAHLPASSVRADVEVAGWGASVRWR